MLSPRSLAAAETKPLGRGLSSDFGNSRALNPPSLPRKPSSAISCA